MCWGQALQCMLVHQNNMFLSTCYSGAIGTRDVNLSVAFVL